MIYFRYVFFVESVFAEYLAGQPPCDLVLLDELLNPSYYAFAVQKHSRLLPHINKAILQLDESGALDRLKRRWWRGKCSRFKFKRLRDQGVKKHGESKGRKKDAPSVEDYAYQEDYDDYYYDDDEYVYVKVDEAQTTPRPKQYYKKVKTRVMHLGSAIQLHASAVTIVMSVIMLLTNVILK